MLNKYFSMLFAILMATFRCAAFASVGMEMGDTWLTPFPELGMEIAFPRGYYESMTISHGFLVDESGETNALTVMFYGESQRRFYQYRAG